MVSLHVYDKKSKTFQPKLKQFLEDTVQKAGLTKEDLITKTGRQLAIGYIQERLAGITSKNKGKSSGDVSRSYGAISQWLSGETLLPSDKNVLVSLYKL